MKNKFFCILLGLFLSVLSMGQNSRLDEGDISLKASNISISNALKAVELKSAEKFSYNPDEVSASDRISVDVQGATLRQALNAILGDGFRYLEMDSHIIIKLKEMSDPLVAASRFSLLIVNRHNGNPVSNVLVMNDQQEVGFTNPYGELQFEYMTGEFNANLTAKGYKDTSLLVTAYGQRVIPISPEQTELKTIDVLPAVINDKPVALNTLFSRRDVKQFSSPPLLKQKDFQFSFLPGIGSDFFNSDDYSYKVSVNLIGGTVGGIRGAEVGWVFNHVKYNLIGFQYASVLNYVNGEMIGLQVSSCMNYLGASGVGLQMSGLTSISMSGIQGGQISGVANILADGPVNAQVAGVLNINQSVVKNIQLAGVCNQSEACRGVQIAGVVNVAQSDTVNVQVAGVTNRAERCRSLQIAPVVNNCTERNYGAQISLLNIADTAHSQFGLVNLSNHSSGAVVGLFSFVKDGYRALELAYTESMTVNMQFKSGQNRFYNIINAGFDFRNEDMGMLLGYGLGTNFYFGRKSMLNIDMTFSHVFERGEFVLAQNHLLRLESEFGYNIGKFVLFAGPSCNFQVSSWRHPETNESLTSFSPGGFYEFVNTDVGVHKHLVWFGFNLGLRL